MITRVISLATSTVTLTANKVTATSTTPVTFTATVKAVAPGSGVPGGTATFSDGVVVLAEVPIIGGKATLTIPLSGSGAHSISVTTSGDGHFRGAITASPRTVTIT